jgi:hypothetical protein
MPPHTRSQRRRQGARQQQRQQRPANQPVQAPDISDVDVPADLSASETAMPAIYDDVAVPRTPTVTAPANPPRAATTRTTRRMRSRVELEPVDYSKDYQAARQDLRWIAIWAVLLFVVMIILRISGIV